MRTVIDPGTGDPDRVLLLLPGRRSRPEDYETRGFVRAARESGIACEIVSPDAHLGYYMRRTIHVRLHEDILRPARSRGRDRVFLAGISLGALGSLITAHEFPGEVDALVLIAPYLGDDDIVGRIEEAGGLSGYAPDRPEDLENLWVWLKGYAEAKETRPPLLLAYGESDRFARAHRLLAAALPPDRVIREPGGHDWPTWGRLWARILRHPLVVEGLARRPGGGEAPTAASPRTR
jgi:pimeloyl-ACP methyl ester carboxylesterase